MSNITLNSNTSYESTESIVDTMKEWLVNRYKDASKTFGDRDKPSALGNIMTPQNIPQFTIPPSVDDLPYRQILESPVDPCSSFPSLANHSSRREFPPKMVSHTSSPCLSIPQNKMSPRNSTSAPTSPSRILIENRLEFQESKLRAVNEDPMSIAALSLAHLKRKTKYGFTTLSERPNTRRKESLFHDDMSPPFLRSRIQRKCKSSDSLRLNGIQSDPNENLRIDTDGKTLNKTHRKRIPMLVAPLGVVPTPQYNSTDSGGASPNISPVISPFSTPELNSIDNGGPGRRTRLYYRRRSSVPAVDSSCQHCSGEDSSSTEPSPDVRRRSSGNINLNASEVTRLLRLQRLNSKVVQEPAFPQSCSMHSLISCSTCSCHSLNKLESQILAEKGELKFGLEYLHETQQLKVTLIKAENLGRTCKGDINPFVKIYLMPGKPQKHVTECQKKTKNPTFNQEFLFNDIVADKLTDMRLRLRVFHKPQSLRKEEFLGEVNFPLKGMCLDQETRFWRDLEQKVEHELGYLEMSVCFEASLQRLQVNILHAQDLPKHTISGAPDTYVKVELSQPGRPDMKKQTKLKKKSINPVYEEEFTFSISPKIQDLNYTIVTVSVYEHGKLRSDSIIGVVKLGFGATEETEYNHWNLVLQHPGREFSAWHHVMGPERERY